MSKKRVYEFAKELELSSKEVLDIAQEAGLDFSSHMASMDADQEASLKNYMKKKQADQEKSADQAKANKDSADKQASGKSAKGKADKGQNQQKQGKNSDKHADKKGKKADKNKNKKGNKKQKGPKNKNKNHNQNNQAPARPKKEKALPEKVVYKEGITVAELAKKLHREPAKLVKDLFMMGVPTNQNQSLGSDEVEIILAEYGVEAEQEVVVDPSDFDHYFEEAEASQDGLVSRPPVVTIMGHVDHGKTTLLDYLRKANVTEGEAGGITQHIGAYQVKSDDRLVTFLDTPGHAAFTTMRARGADVTDIVVIVVAADDGVMPQTVEAINHAKAAEVPIIVAVNKIDKPTANPQRVMQELSEYGLISEDWGGDTIFVEISAKFGQNVDELLEMILLVADVEEYKASSDRLALGSVIEARLDSSKGPIATLLVQHGTLHTGDSLVVGDTHGRVRVMADDSGRRIKTAGPSTPVEITGLQASPEAGDRFVVFEDEKTARAIGEERASRAQERRRQVTHHVTLDNLFETLQEGELKSVSVIIKADVQGSAEALSASLQKIEVEGVKVDIVHSAVGAINEADISLAQASGAIVVGFNVRPTPQAREQASQDGVDIRLHNVIYNAIDEIETAMKGLLDPEYVEEVTGMVQIRETYKVSKVGTIGGAYVMDGYIERHSGVRVIRDNIVIYEGELASLKRFKDDAKRVDKGYECGLMIENYNDIQVDDMIEAYHMVEVKG